MSEISNDLIQSFQLENGTLRGRLVRLGPALDEILKRHNYPPAVNYLLAETIVLACLLAGALKYEGIFTLQTKGDGPISQLVADVTSAGAIRACATFQADKVRGPSLLGSLALLGKGYLAFTVDQGADTDRYQGIVELVGSNMADCARHYFQQSEQIASALMIAVSQDADGTWRGGGVLLQQMPDGETERNLQLSAQDEDWRRATALLQTLTKDELLTPTLKPEELLWRLYHEEGVRAFEPQILKHGCRCSRERVEQVLQSLPEQEIRELEVDGKISVDCEFCGNSYMFTDQELEKLYQDRKNLSEEGNA